MQTATITTTRLQTYTKKNETPIVKKRVNNFRGCAKNMQALHIYESLRLKRSSKVSTTIDRSAGQCAAMVQERKKEKKVSFVLKVTIIKSMKDKNFY